MYVTPAFFFLSENFVAKLDKLRNAESHRYKGKNLCSVCIYFGARAHKKADRGGWGDEKGEEKKRRNVNHGLFLWRMKTDVKK